MRIKLHFIIILAMIVFASSFVLSVNIPEIVRGNDALLYQTCNNCTYCNLTSVKNNFGDTLLPNGAFDKNDTYYSKVLNGSNTTTVGTYTYCYDCGNEEQAETGCINFKVISSENLPSLYDLWARIFLILFFIGLMFALFFVTHKINFEQWSNKVMKKYETKNFIKFIFSAMTYHLMKQSFIIYYLLGLPIMMILANITYAYNVTGLVTFMNSLLLVYTIGIILVGLVFLSYVQEWSMMMIDMLKDENWGIANDK